MKKKSVKIKEALNFAIWLHHTHVQPGRKESALLLINECVKQ